MDLQEELELYKKQFQGTFNSAAHGMVIANIDGTLKEVNAAFCAMMGYGSDELVGKHFTDFSAEEKLKNDVDYYNRAVSGEIDSYSLEKK